jgi:phage-related tail protein
MDEQELAQAIRAKIEQINDLLEEAHKHNILIDIAILKPFFSNGATKLSVSKISKEL